MCQCAKFDQFLPARSHFGSKRPENLVRIAKFSYAAFGPLFAFHCPLFLTRNNDLECKSSRFAAVDRRSVGDKQLHLKGVIHLVRQRRGVTLHESTHNGFLQIMHPRTFLIKNPSDAKLASLSVFRKWPVSMATIAKIGNY